MTVGINAIDGSIVLFLPNWTAERASNSFRPARDGAREADASRGAQAAPQENLTSGLERLAALFNSGALSDEEYQAAKRELLNLKAP